MDLIGQAIYNYHFNGNDESLVIDSNYTEDEVLDPSHFFRTYDLMSAIEKRALDLCRGKILDVGAGAGCHALELQNRALRVTALEKSELACQVMTDRGVEHIVTGDMMDHTGIMYDTILLLMNGAGLAGTMQGLERMLAHLKTLLAPGGQILMDSTDIIYLFQEDDGSLWIDLANNNYYGEMTYTIKYRNKTGDPFPWLFVDFESLSQYAGKQGFKTELVMEGEDGDYLARLVHLDNSPI